MQARETSETSQTSDRRAIILEVEKGKWEVLPQGGYTHDAAYKTLYSLLNTSLKTTAGELFGVTQESPRVFIIQKGSDEDIKTFLALQRKESVLQYFQDYFNNRHHPDYFNTRHHPQIDRLSNLYKDKALIIIASSRADMAQIELTNDANDDRIKRAIRSKLQKTGCLKTSIQDSVVYINLKEGSSLPEPHNSVATYLTNLFNQMGSAPRQASKQSSTLISEKRKVEGSNKETSDRRVIILEVEKGKRWEVQPQGDYKLDAACSTFKAKLRSTPGAGKLFSAILRDPKVLIFRQPEASDEDIKAFLDEQEKESVLQYFQDYKIKFRRKPINHYNEYKNNFIIKAGETKDQAKIEFTVAKDKIRPIKNAIQHTLGRDKIFTTRFRDSVLYVTLKEGSSLPEPHNSMGTYIKERLDKMFGRSRSRQVKEQSLLSSEGRGSSLQGEELTQINQMNSEPGRASEQSSALISEEREVEGSNNHKETKLPTLEELTTRHLANLGRSAFVHTLFSPNQQNQNSKRKRNDGNDTDEEKNKKDDNQADTQGVKVTQEATPSSTTANTEEVEPENKEPENKRWRPWE